MEPEFEGCWRKIDEEYDAELGIKIEVYVLNIECLKALDRFFTVFFLRLGIELACSL